MKKVICFCFCFCFLSNVKASELRDNWTLDSDVNLESTLTIPEGVNVTIDLNGHSITVSERESGRHYYAIDNYGDLKIRDSKHGGTIMARGIENLSSGKLTVESGKIIAQDSNGGAAIWNEGELIINGGQFETLYVGKPSDMYGAGCLNNSGKVVINNGTFNSVNRRTYSIISTGEIKVESANVTGAHGGIAIDSGTGIINGGSFTSSEYYGLYVSNDGMGNPEEARVTVNDGNFTGKNYSVWIGSDVNNPVTSTIQIKGGVYNNPLSVQNNVTLVNGIRGIIVSGGIFNQSSYQSVENFLADNYKIFKDGDNYVVDSDGNIEFDIPIYLSLNKDYQIDNKSSGGYKKYGKLVSNDDNLKIENDTIVGTKVGKYDVTIRKNDISSQVEVVSVYVYNLMPDKTVSKDEEVILNWINKNAEISEDVKYILENGPKSSLDIKKVKKNDVQVKNGYELLGCYDIDLLLQSSDESRTYKIKSLGDKIKITLDIPDDIKKLDENMKRDFSVTRVHDGVSEELDVKVDDKITFESDKFSLFVLSYRDSYKEEANPQTLDNIGVFIGLLLISSIGLFIIKKKYI